MIFVNIQPIFKARGIEQPSKFLIKNGITRNVTYALVSGQTRNIKLDHIEKLCRALNCEPNDLFQFKEHTNDTLPKNHPLFNLKRNEEVPNLKKSLNSLPYKQLIEVTKTIQQQINQDAKSENEPSKTENK